MALQASGPISFSQIAAEFGLPPGRNIGAYRVNQTVGSLSNLPLDAGVPQSGTIKFSDFYSKKLNMVVPYSGTQYRVNARGTYNTGSVVVIGGYRSRPSNSSGTKVFVNVHNASIGSAKGDNRTVALRTGGWDGGTTLQVDVSSTSGIYGAGGDGGIGGSECEGRANGTSGATGTSAIGVEYAGTTIINRGYIQCGYGGGGGGGCASSDPDKNQRDFGAAGGGGGGGAGFPTGSGGRGGYGCQLSYRPISGGNSGGNSTTTVRGGGGSGGSNPGCTAGAGGSGGDHLVGQQNGGSGSGNTGPIGSGGATGGDGYAIVSSVSGSFSLSNYGTVYGSTAYTSVV